MTDGWSGIVASKAAPRRAPSSRSWIFDYDHHRFEPYADDRGVDELIHHTSSGEIIVYLSDTNTLWVIENGKATPWPDDEVLEVLDMGAPSRPFYPSEFRP